MSFSLLSLGLLLTLFPFESLHAFYLALNGPAVAGTNITFLFVQNGTPLQAAWYLQEESSDGTETVGPFYAPSPGLAQGTVGVSIPEQTGTWQMVAMDFNPQTPFYSTEFVVSTSRLPLTQFGSGGSNPATTSSPSPTASGTSGITTGIPGNGVNTPGNAASTSAPGSTTAVQTSPVQTSPSSNEAHIGAIVGAVVGALVLLNIILLCAYCLFRRAKLQKRDKAPPRRIKSGQFERTSSTVFPTSLRHSVEEEQPISSMYGSSPISPLPNTPGENRQLRRDSSVTPFAAFHLTSTPLPQKWKREANTRSNDTATNNLESDETPPEYV